MFMRDLCSQTHEPDGRKRQAIPSAKSPVSVGGRTLSRVGDGASSPALVVYRQRCPLPTVRNFLKCFGVLAERFPSSLLLFSWDLGACDTRSVPRAAWASSPTFSISGPAFEKFFQISFAISLVYTVSWKFFFLPVLHLMFNRNDIVDISLFSRCGSDTLSWLFDCIRGPWRDATTLGQLVMQNSPLEI